jgi:hypothetical protein
MRIRTIEAGIPDLPANFAVVSGRTAEEGVANIAAAFRECPEVNLVSWPGAIDLVAPRHRDTIARMFEEIFREMDDTNGKFIGHIFAAQPQNPVRRLLSAMFSRDKTRGIREAFKEVAGAAGPERLEAVAAWEKSTLDITAALDSTYEVSGVKSDVRVRRNAGEYDFHDDDFAYNFAILLRNVAGDAALYAATKDSLPVDARDLPAVRHIREETRVLWTPLPWALTVQASRPGARGGCVHTVAANDLHPQGALRALEAMLIRTRKPVAPHGP